MSVSSYRITTALESAQAIKHQRHVVPLSEQQLLDCSTPNQGGCWPWNIHEILNYVVRNPRVPLAVEARYPYRALSNTSLYPKACHDRRSQRSDASRLFEGKETYNGALDTINDDLLMRLISKGPIAITMSSDFMGDYKAGIYRGPCGQRVNHAVLLTGWGVDSKSGVPYW